MKRYFSYELKKNLGAFVVITAIMSVLYVITTSTATLFDGRPWADVLSNRWRYNRSTQIGVIYTMLGIISFVVPVLMYSFKMNKRSIDAFYSLPVKREKIYLVKTLVGLFLVLVPYTIAYWLGFLTIALRENYFYLIHYFSGYFGGLLYGICIYGICSFAFTRANRIIDGVIFILAYTFVGCMVVGTIGEIFDIWVSDFIWNFTPFGGLIDFGNNINSLIRCDRLERYYEWNTSMFLYPVLFASISYFLMFFLLKYEKGENAEQNSDSWFGYRTLIPVYMALFLGFVHVTLRSWNEVLLFVCLSVVSGVVLTIVYKRKVFFGWRCCCMIGAGLAVGLILMVA